MRQRLPENVSFYYNEDERTIKIVIEGKKFHWDAISSEIQFPPYAHRDEDWYGSVIRDRTRGVPGRRARLLPGGGIGQR